MSDHTNVLAERESSAELDAFQTNQPAFINRSSDGTSLASDVTQRTWFTRLSGVYSVAERQIARGAKAIQKLAAPLSHQAEVKEARSQLENLASSLKGAERQRYMRHWLHFLEKPSEISPALQPILVAEPASPCSSIDEDEEDWQQLSSLPIAGRATQHNTTPLPSGAGFRQLFLSSNAFQNLIQGYSIEPPADETEKDLLLRMLHACCGESVSCDDLWKVLDELGQSHKHCQEDEVDEKAIQDIAQTAAAAVCGLQISDAMEEAEDKLEILKEEMAEQAATTALLHKFNHSDESPGKEVTQKRLVQGLAATSEIMTLGEALCRLAEGKLQLVQNAKTSNHEETIDSLHQRSVLLASNFSLAELELSENIRQQEESKAFKERKLNDMDQNAATLQAEVRDLQASRAALLAQLEKVELSLAKAQAKQADLEEGKHVFEEGSNFTIQALEQQATQLHKQQKQCEAENKALTACKKLLSHIRQAQAEALKAANENAGRAVLRFAEEYSHASTRHLYFQRAQLQFLLRKLAFCGTELAEGEMRHKRAIKLEMNPLLDDVLREKLHLMQQYLEAEAMFDQSLQEIGSVHERTQQMNDKAKMLLPPHCSIEQGSEMQDILKSIGKLKDDFERLKRPNALPEPGTRPDELQALLNPLTRGSTTASKQSSESSSVAHQSSQSEDWPSAQSAGLDQKSSDAKSQDQSSLEEVEQQAEEGLKDIP